MQVRLAGVKQVTRYLADGRTVTYYYAWTGGPRLQGEPGSPEFAQSYAAAHRERRQPKPSTLHSVIVGYKASADFDKLRDRTKHDYLQQIAKIEVQFGDLPLSALDDARVTRDFLEWRDEMAASPRKPTTPGPCSCGCSRGHAAVASRRIGHPSASRGCIRRIDRTRSGREADVAKFNAVAPATLQRALALALDTGQRQGDLLILPWSAYDGAWIRLRQSKGGRKVAIPVTQRLKAVIEATPTTSPIILTSSTGRPWKDSSFRNAWADATRAAGISGLTFHDLRGTAVTRLSEAGCSLQEIATITGHSLRDVGAIIDRYSGRTDKLAQSAMAKLERART